MCSVTGCLNPQNSFGGKCLYHHKYNDEPKPPKQIKPIPKESKKRKDENKEYNKERKLYLKANNQCEAKLQGCKKIATQIHHRKGRVGKLLTDVKYWLPVCEDCHRKIEDNPKMAYENGLSLKRNTKI